MKTNRLPHSSAQNTLRVEGNKATLQTYLFEMWLMRLVEALPCPYLFFPSPEVVFPSIYPPGRNNSTAHMVLFIYEQKFALLRSGTRSGLFCTVPFYCSQ